MGLAADIATAISPVSHLEQQTEGPPMDAAVGPLRWVTQTLTA
jgi:hypothetical protein